MRCLALVDPWLHSCLMHSLVIVGRCVGRGNECAPLLLRGEKLRAFRFSPLAVRATHRRMRIRPSASLCSLPLSSLSSCLLLPPLLSSGNSGPRGETARGSRMHCGKAEFCRRGRQRSMHTEEQRGGKRARMGIVARHQRREPAPRQRRRDRSASEQRRAHHPERRAEAHPRPALCIPLQPLRSTPLLLFSPPHLPPPLAASCPPPHSRIRPPPPVPPSPLCLPPRHGLVFFSSGVPRRCCSSPSPVSRASLQEGGRAATAAAARRIQYQPRVTRQLYAEGIKTIRRSITRTQEETVIREQQGHAGAVRRRHANAAGHTAPHTQQTTERHSERRAGPDLAVSLSCCPRC